MKSDKKRLGDYIREVDVRNKSLEVTAVRGISTAKYMIPSVANLEGVDMSGYKTVRPKQFVYVPDTSRRGEKAALAMCEGESCIVSSIYTVFEIIDKNELIPEYLMLWFKRPEFNRYARIHSIGSAREVFDWEDMCEMEIVIPDKKNQMKQVALYSGMLSKQGTYERSIADLEMICDSYLENLKKEHTSIKIAPYIREVDTRNADLLIDNLLGISITKKFIPSIANQDELDLHNYKIVKPGQLAFVSVTSRNGGKLSIALLNGDAGVVSSTYTVFEITDQNKILPEFLYLWFKRSEFDRYARFHSIGSAREVFDWEDMCEVKIPIPDLEAQRAIIAIHHALEKRKNIAQKLNELLAPLCPVLIRGVSD